MSSCAVRPAANVPPVRRVAVLASLVLAACTGPADAAIVARTAEDAALALAPDGSPRVAYAAAGELFLASPRPDGTWSAARVARLPTRSARVAGLEIDPRGRPFVLVQDEDGRWLRLADRVDARWRSRSVASGLPAGAVLGHSGLELDRVGKPAVAYAYRLPDRKTFLRLVTGGAFRTISITREGFPESAVVPSAAPVRMPDGKLRVLETYAARGGGAILWRHSGEDWRGLFLSSSVGGTLPVGPVFARATGDAFAAAWTLAGPIPGELQARVAPRPDRPESNVLHRRARVQALTLSATGPELAAVEPVGELSAGLLLANGQTFELDGRPLGLEAALEGARHLLLAGAEGLAYYRSPTAPAVSVSLTGTRAGDGSVALSGRVEGSPGGPVTLYRERGSGGRDPAGTTFIGPDGTFSLTDSPGPAPLRYRAVYLDPLSRIPHASLLRGVV
jgi:hypothetical protein